MAESSVNYSVNLVRKLCSHLTGLPADEDSVTPFLQYALYTLGTTSFSHGHDSNEFEVAERIKKKMMKRGKQQDALKFSELYRKLQGQSILQDRWKILTLLYALSCDSNQSNKTYSSGTRSNIALFSSSSPILITSQSGTMISTSRTGSSLSAVTGVKSGASENVNRFSSSSLSLVKSGTSATSRPLVGHQRESSVLRSSSSNIPDGTVARVKSSSLTTAGHSLQLLDSTPSEQELLRELVFTWQGIEGNLVEYSHRNDRFQLKDKIPIPGHIRQLVERIAECGWLHNKIRKYLDSRSSGLALGLVGQSFCAALQEQLQEYYKLIAVFHSQLQQHEETNSRNLNLKIALLWSVEPKQTLMAIAGLIDAVQGKTGGALVSVIHAHMFHGDPHRQALAKHIINIISKPIYSMLLKWIYDGELVDKYSEFFVALDDSVNEDKLWQDKYRLRKPMIPESITMEQAHKILLIGKSINFLHKVCSDTSLTRRRSKEVATEVLSTEKDGQLQTMIDKAYTETSLHLLNILNKDFNFFEHLRAMRRYLMLGQGDFILCLMDLLEVHLAKPANTLYLHNLTGLLESAIRATNAQYDDGDVLKRLDVRLLEISPGDIGWDVFTLDYHVDGPIGTVFSDECKTNYLQMFNFLWRAKRMEYLLSTVWRMLTSECRCFYTTVPELSPILHHSCLLASEMMHFTQQMQYYITFEVLACSWDVLSNKVHEAKDLDDIISAHSDFLQSVITRSLLGREAQTILYQLRAIFDIIIKFQHLTEKVFSKSMEEQEARKTYANLPEQRARLAQWGKTAAEVREEEKRRLHFEQKYIPAVKSKLRLLSQSYQEMVQKFLLMVNDVNDISLQSLSFRLDFNEHYKSRDSRLRTSLSFQKKLSTLAGKQWSFG